MRIDLLITGLGLGGAEMQVVHLARAFRRLSHPVRVIGMTGANVHAEALREAEVPVVSLGMRPGIPDPRGVPRLAAVLNDDPPDVLHSHMVHANLLARVTRIFHRVPALVCTAHNTWEGGRLRELGYRLTDPLADVTTNVSRAAVERYLRVKAIRPERAQYVPNGIDVDGFEPATPELRNALRGELGVGSGFCWLWVGRMVREKNPCGAVEAFASLCSAFPDARLWMVGDGPELPRVRDTLRERGLERAVSLLGRRRDVPSLMSAADALVCSSSVEGLPMVLLEAAACGLPIVTTSAGGCPEAVVPGRSGLVVERPEHLPEAMRRVMSQDAAALARMGEAARAHVREHYGLPQVAAQWLALYAELLGREA